MIELSPIAAASVAAGNQRRHVRVESWYDDRLLDDDIPVDAGRLEMDRSVNVPERVTLTVPRLAGGVDYTPTAEDSPLGANGQLLRVLVGIGIDRGQTEWLQMGWYVITESEPRGDGIEVEAAGLLWKIDEARLITPFQPTGTFAATVRKLVEPAIPVVFDPALVDRAVPPGTNADDNRLEALNLILRGWPAEAAVTPEGFLYVTADTDSAVVNTALTDGLGGTVIRSDGSSTRVGVYNAVVARGNNTAGTAIQAVAYDRTTPKRDGGPFSELPVPLFYDTPFVNNQKVAQIIAATRLRTLLRQAARSFDVEMVPNPAIQVGDRLALTVAREVPDLQVLVDALTLPLTADGGAMTLRVRVA